jgi:hypothetical protein
VETYEYHYFLPPSSTSSELWKEQCHSLTIPSTTVETRNTGLPTAVPKQPGLHVQLELQLQQSRSDPASATAASHASATTTATSPSPDTGTAIGTLDRPLVGLEQGKRRIERRSTE